MKSKKDSKSASAAQVRVPALSPPSTLAESNETVLNASGDYHQASGISGSAEKEHKMDNIVAAKSSAKEKRAKLHKRRRSLSGKAPLIHNSIARPPPSKNSFVKPGIPGLTSGARGALASPPNPNSAAGKLYGLIADEALASGTWQWLKHDELGYVPARYVFGEGRSCVYETIYGETIEGVSRLTLVEGGDILGGHPIPIMANLARTYSDMVHMDDTNEASILHNIRLRFDEDEFMTNVGSILVLVNPFRWFEHLYTLDQVQKYFRWRLGDPLLDPHVYQIAESAYRGIVAEGKSQAVIISGESGAGKTEATKKVLQYLACVASGREGLSMSDGNQSKSGIESRLLAANPVLEAFGNAKTVRNNNSSRFGKWMELQFDKKSLYIKGCSTQNYLLEKVRLVSQAKSERNFHVFYQFLSASNHAVQLRKSIGGFSDDMQVNAKAYRILHETGGCVKIPGLNDSEEFEDTFEALQNLGFQTSEIEEIFRIVAAILHLGNISFRCADNSDYAGNIDAMDADSIDSAELAATALGISPSDMVDNLIAKTLYVRGTEMSKSLIPSDAEKARDSMIKGVYGKMFDWLVLRVNGSLKPDVVKERGELSSDKNDDTCVIGVLDIFGFEIFEHNSFEQLCINFANEKLQQHFNMSTFKNEQALYEAEKISNIPTINFVDNKDLINVIEKQRSPPGLLVMLDEEARLGQSGSDANFLKKVGKVHGASTRVRLKTVQDKKTMLDSEFWISHYAGDVKYDASGFLSKNRDELFQNIKDVLASSKLKLISGQLFNSQSALATSQTDFSSKRRFSLGGQFRLQLLGLMKTISSASPHYIRCIKPNALKRPRIFDAKLSLEQLRCSGIFEAVEIRKQGFPFRLHHNLFYNRYVPIVKSWSKGGPIASVPAAHDAVTSLSDTIATVLAGSSVKTDGVSMLLQVFARASPEIMSSTSCQRGRNMILYRAQQHRWLEMQRESVAAESVVLIQACARSYLARVLCSLLARHRHALREAIRSRSSDLISQALEDAHEAQCSRLVDYTEAKGVLNIVVQEEEVRETLLRLKGVEVEGKHFEELCRCIDLAAELGIDEEANIVEWKRRLQSVRLRVETRMNLVKGVRECDPDILEKAIENAYLIRDELNLSNFCEEELATAKTKLEHLSLEVLEINKLRDVVALQEEAFNPDDNHLSEDRLRVSPSLQASVIAAEKIGFETPKGLFLLQICKLLLELRPLCAEKQWADILDILSDKANHLPAGFQRVSTNLNSKGFAGQELLHMHEAAANGHAMSLIHKILIEYAITFDKSGRLNTSSATNIKTCYKTLEICKNIFEHNSTVQMSVQVRSNMNAVRDMLTLRSAVYEDSWDKVSDLLDTLCADSGSLNDPARGELPFPELEELQLIRDANFSRQVVIRVASGILEGSAKALDKRHKFELDHLDLSRVTFELLENGLSHVSRLAKSMPVKDKYVSMLIGIAQYILELRQHLSSLEAAGLLPLQPTYVSFENGSHEASESTIMGGLTQNAWDSLEMILGRIEKSQIIDSAKRVMKSAPNSLHHLSFDPLESACEEIQLVQRLMYDKKARISISKGLMGRSITPPLEKVEGSSHMLEDCKSYLFELSKPLEKISKHSPATHNHSTFDHVESRDCLNLAVLGKYVLKLRSALYRQNWNKLTYLLSREFVDSLDQNDTSYQYLFNILQFLEEGHTGEDATFFGILGQEIIRIRDHFENSIIISSLTQALGKGGCTTFGIEEIKDMTGDSRNIMSSTSDLTEIPIGRLDTSSISCEGLEIAQKKCALIPEGTLHTLGSIKARSLRVIVPEICVLRNALSSNDWMEVKRLADKLISKYTNDTGPAYMYVEAEAMRAKYEAEHHLLVKMSREACLEGGPRGKIGDLILETIKTDKLNGAVSCGHLWGCQSVLAKVAIRTVELVQKIRACLTIGDWQGVEGVIRKAHRYFDNSRARQKNQERLPESAYKSSQESTISSAEEDVGLLVESHFELERVRLEMLNNKIISTLSSALSHGRINDIPLDERMGLLQNRVLGTKAHDYLTVISTRDIDIALSEWANPQHSVDSFLLEKRDATHEAFGNFPSHKAEKLLASAKLLRGARRSLKQRDASSLYESLKEIVGTSKSYPKRSGIVKSYESDSATFRTVQVDGVSVSKAVLMEISRPDFGHSLFAEVAWEEVTAIRNIWLDYVACTSLTQSILNNTGNEDKGARIDKVKNGLAQIDAAWDLMSHLGLTSGQTEDSLLSTYGQQLFACSKTIYSVKFALKNSDMTRLRRALEDAAADMVLKEFLDQRNRSSTDLQSKVSHEIQNAQLKLNDWLNMSELRAVLNFGMAKGEVGHLNLASIELESLDTAIANSRTRGCATEAARVALKTGQLVRRIRSAIKFMDWSSLRAVLDEWDKPDWQRKWVAYSHNLQPKSETSEPLKNAEHHNIEIEIRRARAELHNKDLIDLLNLALIHGTIKGEAGSLDLSYCNTKNLDAAIRMCGGQLPNSISEEANDILYAARVVRDIRTSLMEENYDTLEQILAINYAPQNELSTAISCVEYFQKRKKPQAYTFSRSESMPELLSLYKKHNAESKSTAIKQRMPSLVLRSSSTLPHSHLSSKATANIVIAAKRVITHPSALSEIRLAQAHMDNRSIIVETIHALSVGCPLGSVGDLDLSQLNVDSLKKVVEICGEGGPLQPQTENAKRMVEACLDVYKIRCILMHVTAEAHSSKYDISSWKLAHKAITQSSLLKNAFPSIAIEELSLIRFECENKIIVAMLTKALDNNDGAFEVYRKTIDINTDENVKGRNVFQEFNEEDLSTATDLNLSLYVGETSLESLENTLREVDLIMKDKRFHHRWTKETEQLLYSSRIMLSLRTDVLRDAWDLVSHTISSVYSENGPNQKSKLLSEPARMHRCALREFNAIVRESKNRICLEALSTCVREDNLGVHGKPGSLDLLGITESIRQSKEALQKIEETGVPFGRFATKSLVSAMQFLVALRISVQNNDWEEVCHLVGERQATSFDNMSLPNEGNKSVSLVVEPYLDSSESLTAKRDIMEGLISDAIEQSLCLNSASVEIDVGKNMYSEYFLIRLELENRIALILLSDAVQSGGASGSIGELDCSTIETQALSYAIQYSHKMVENAKVLLMRHNKNDNSHRTSDLNLTTQEVSLLLQNAQLVLRIRNALLESHWGHLEAAILDSKSGAVIEFVSAEVSHARYECENRQIFEQLSEALDNGRPLLIGSEEWVTHARNMRNKTPKNDLTEEKKMLYDKGLLDLATVDISQLESAIATAERFQCRTTIAKDLHRIACLIRDLRKALKEIPTFSVVSNTFSKSQSLLQVSQNFADFSIIDIVVNSSPFMQAASAANGKQSMATQDLDAGSSSSVVLTPDVKMPLKIAIDNSSLFDPSQYKEITNIQEDLYEREVRARLADAIVNATDRVSGSVGKLRLHHVSVTRLDTAIRLAHEFGCKTDANRKLLAAAQVLRRLRSEIRASEWELLRRTVDSATNLIYMNNRQRLENTKSHSLKKSATSKNPLSNSELGSPAKSNQLLRKGSNLSDAIDLSKSIKESLGEKKQRSRHSRRTSAADAIEQASRSQIKQSVVELALECFELEVQIIQAESNDRSIVLELKTGLEEGKLCGVAGNVDISSISTTWLKKAIETARDMNPSTKHAKLVINIAKKILLIREFIKKNDWHGMKSSLLEGEKILLENKKSEKAVRSGDDVSDSLSDLGVASVASISSSSESDTDDEEDETSHGKKMALQALAVASEELKIVRDEMDNQEIVKSFTDALKCGAAIKNPKTGQLDISSIDYKPIEKALRAATVMLTGISLEDLDKLPLAKRHIDHKLLKTRKARHIIRTAKIILRMRKALKAGDWTKVEDALNDARLISSKDFADGKLQVTEHVRMISAEEKRNRINIEDTRRIISTENDRSGLVSMDVMANGSNMHSIGVSSSEKQSFLFKTFRGLHHVAREEAFYVQDMIDDRRIIQKLLKSMTVGSVTGPIGNRHVSNISTEQLDEAINEAKAFKCTSDTARSLLASAIVIQKIRNAWKAQVSDVSLSKLKSVLDLHVNFLKQKVNRLTKREAISGSLSRFDSETSSSKRSDSLGQYNNSGGMISINSSELESSSRFLITRTALGTVAHSDNGTDSKTSDQVATANNGNSTLNLSLPLADIALKEVEDAFYEVENQHIIESLRTALSHGSARGEVGSLDLNDISTNQLEAAIAEAMYLGPKTEEANKLLKTAKYVRVVRSSLQHKDWQSLDDTFTQISESLKKSPTSKSIDITSSKSSNTKKEEPLEVKHHRRASTVWIKWTSNDAKLQASIDLSPEALPELQKIKQELINWKIMHVLTKGIEHFEGGGRVSGRVGELNLNCVSVGPLDVALTKTRAFIEELKDLSALSKRNESHFQSDQVSNISTPYGKDTSMNGRLQRLRQLRHRNSSRQSGIAEHKPADLKERNSPKLSLAVRKLIRAAELIHSLRSLLTEKNADWVQLLNVIQNAGPLQDLPQVAQDEISLIRSEVLDRTAIERLKAALTQGGPNGSVNDIDLQNVTTEHLESAIRYAETVGCASNLARDLLGTANSCKKLRLSFLQRDFQGLRQAVHEVCDHPEGFKLTHSELCLMQDVLDNYFCADLIRRGLRKGRIIGEPGHLINVDEEYPTSHMPLATSDNASAYLDSDGKFSSDTELKSSRKAISSSESEMWKSTLDEASVESMRSFSDVLNASHFYRDDARHSTHDKGSITSSMLSNRENESSDDQGVAVSTTQACNSVILREAISRACALHEKSKEVSALLIVGHLIANLRDALRMKPKPDWNYAKRLCLHARGKTGHPSAKHHLSNDVNNDIVTLHALGGKELPDPITDQVLEYLGPGDCRLVLAEIELVESDIEERHVSQMLREALKSGSAICMSGSINVSTVDLSQLDAALSSAKTAGVLAGEGRALLLTAVLLRSMRAALLNGPDWQKVRVAIERLEECETFDVVLDNEREYKVVSRRNGESSNEISALMQNQLSPEYSVNLLRGVHVLVANEVAAVREEVELHFRTRGALLQVISAAERRELDPLRTALSTARKLGMHESTDLNVVTQMIRAQDLADRLGEAHVRLEEALEVFDGKMPESEYERRRGYLNGHNNTRRNFLTHNQSGDQKQMPIRTSIVQSTFSFNALQKQKPAYMKSALLQAASSSHSIVETRPEILRNALNHAKRVGYGQSKQADKVRALLQSMDTLENLARDACETVDRGKIERILITARAHTKWQPWDVHSKTESVPSKTSANPVSYKERLDNGAQPGFPCPLLTRETQTMCRRLLALPERQLLQCRLNNALASQDVERIVDTTVEIKTIYFEDALAAIHGRTNRNEITVLNLIPEAFQFSRLRCLRPLKSPNKIMHFSHEPILNSLTKLDNCQRTNENTQLVCIKMFKNVMGFMGDRKYSYPETLGRELLEACLLHSVLRDELYLQVIRQLHGNPDTRSNELGYALLSLCLKSFPPSSELENCIEFFLRRNNRAHLVRQLHYILYKGAVESEQDLPSEADIAKARSTAIESDPKFGSKIENSDTLHHLKEVDSGFATSHQGKTQNKDTSLKWDEMLQWARDMKMDAHGVNSSGGVKQEPLVLTPKIESLRAKEEILPQQLEKDRININRQDAVGTPSAPDTQNLSLDKIGTVDSLSADISPVDESVSYA